MVLESAEIACLVHVTVLEPFKKAIMARKTQYRYLWKDTWISLYYCHYMEGIWGYDNGYNSRELKHR